MGCMLDSDWSRKFLLRCDWLGPIGAPITTFILAHTGRYNNNSDLFVLAISLTMHVYPKLKTSEAGQGGYFPSYTARSICV